MKKICLIALALLSVCASCKKDKNGKEDSGQAAIAAEFDAIANNPDVTVEDAHASTSFLIEGTAAVPAYYQRVNLYTAGGLTEFHMDFPCGELAPSKRGIKPGYYIWTPESEDTRNTFENVQKAVLRVSKAGSGLPRYSIALVIYDDYYQDTRYRIRHSTLDVNESFALAPVPFASDYSFPKSTAVSGRYLHLPVDGETFDLLELTFDSRSEGAGGALLPMHFVLTPIKSFQGNAGSVAGTYSVGTLFNQWANKKILSSLSECGDRFDYYNKWGEVSSIAYYGAGTANLSVSEDSSRISIGGEFTMYPFFFSSDVVSLAINGLSIKVSDIREE